MPFNFDAGCEPNPPNPTSILTPLAATCKATDFFINNQPDALNISNLFCYKTLHVSGTFSVHHQEFSTVHSALVSFIPVLMTTSKQSQDGNEFAFLA
jgi:hypothetical protein